LIVTLGLRHFSLNVLNMKSFLILFVLAGSALAVKHIPLRRIKPLRQTMKANGQWEEYLKLKEIQGMVDASKNEALSIIDMEYVGQVQIGTPAQTFSVVMDTGSATLIVPSSDCASTYDCKGRNLYDSSKSSTYKSNGRKFSVQYGFGNLSGIMDDDKVCIAGICVTGQPFGAATTLPALFPPDQPIDGVLGLAFQSQAQDRQIPPVYNMIQQGLLDNPWFTIWMTAAGDGGGQITLGDYDTKHCSATCNWVPLSSAGLYQFTLDSYRIGTALQNNSRGIGRIKPQANAAGAAAISDTSKSFIYGPKSDIDNICTSLGGKSVAGIYTIPCDAGNLPDVIFTIAGIDYPITSANYVQPDGTGKCVLGFEGQRNLLGPKWIFGDIFIREYCNVYDMTNQRLGLCKATS